MTCCRKVGGQRGSADGFKPTELQVYCTAAVTEEKQKVVIKEHLRHISVLLLTWRSISLKWSATVIDIVHVYFPGCSLQLQNECVNSISGARGRITTHFHPIHAAGCCVLKELTELPKRCDPVPAFKLLSAPEISHSCRLGHCDQTGEKTG